MHASLDLDDASGLLYALVVSVHANYLADGSVLLYWQQVLLQLQKSLVEDDSFHIGLRPHHV